MTEEQRAEMNAKLDVLFSQIDGLDDAKKEAALAAMGLWKLAKTFEFLGLGPMEARHEYKAAYSALRDLGLDLGGMIPPYQTP